MQLISIFLIIAIFCLYSHADPNEDAEVKAIVDLDYQLGPAIQRKRKIVPSWVYHGKTKDRIEGFSDGIPKEVWNTRYSESREYRKKGLFVTATLHQNMFANDWMMRIKLKDSCRDPEKVFDFDLMRKSMASSSDRNVISSSSLQSTAFNVDDRFLGWFYEKYSPQNMASCINSQNSIVPESAYSWNNQKHYRFTSISDFLSHCDAGRERRYIEIIEQECENVVSRFLQDKDIKIVTDNNDGIDALVILDHSCIEKIETRPEELLKFLIDEPFSWIPRSKRPKIMYATYSSLICHILEAMPGSIDPLSLKKLNVRLDFAADFTKTRVTSDYYKEILPYFEKIRSCVAKASN